MTLDIDIYRTANELIKQHGEHAAIHAAMKADEMLAKADVDGQAAWMRIMKAIDELQAEDVPEGESVH